MRQTTWYGVIAGLAGLIGLGASIVADFQGVVLGPFTQDLIRELIVPLGLAGVGASTVAKVVTTVRARHDDEPRDVPAHLQESNK